MTHGSMVYSPVYSQGIGAWAVLLVVGANEGIVQWSTQNGPELVRVSAIERGESAAGHATQKLLEEIAPSLVSRFSEASMVSLPHDKEGRLSQREFDKLASR
jgi:hypothetical protein